MAKNLTFGMPTFTGTGSSAMILTIPITIDTAFTKDLDNVGVTKTFKLFDSGSGTFEDFTVAPTFTADPDNKTTKGTITFDGSGIIATSTILVSFKDASVPADDTGFSIRDLYTAFNGSGDSTEQIPLLLSADAGSYRAQLDQIDETGYTINSSNFDVSKPPTTATLSVVTDYVSISPSTVVKVSITGAKDVDNATFDGSIRSSLKIIAGA